MTTTAEIVQATNASDWNKRIISNPDGGTVFSSFEYAQIKKLTGYSPLFIQTDDIAITVLEKNTPPIGKLWYIPKGPGVTSASQLLEVLAALKPLAKKAGVFVIRVESELPRDSSSVLREAGLVKAAAIIPSASTITLDISQDLNEVLMKLPQKGRHAIRRAERDGVSVKKVTVNDENSEIMYELLKDTAEGQFGIRSFEYYKTYWETFASAHIGQLFFAYFEGEVVAGAYAMVFGNKSTYKDGASIRKRTAYGASHFLQWNVIDWAKSQGATIHDFCGSPPSDELNNPNHPHHGIGLFKTAFNKTVIDYIGCYDYILAPTKYKLWKKGLERVHKKIYRVRTNDFYY